MKLKETASGLLALTFANSLVNREFAIAHSMLSQKLKNQLSPNDIETEFDSKINYGETPPNSVEVMDLLDNWPDKKNNDIGWVYCSIEGLDDFESVIEGIAVIIANEENNHVIRKIEWGRP